MFEPKKMSDMTDEEFLRELQYTGAFHKQFADDVTPKEVVGRLAGIVLDLYYKVHPERLGS
jgi:hypothetical protein